MLGRAFSLYERALLARPLTTKARRPPSPQRIYFVRLLNGRRVCRLAPQAISSALISGLGDAACQLVLEKRDELDVRRLSIFTALGGVMVGPTLHAWYSFLHTNVPGATASSIGKRLLLDQFIFAPLFIPSFMVVLSACEGAEDPFQLAKSSWADAVVTNWRLWIPAQVINFGVVKPHFQVLFANGVAVVWNVYLSWTSHRDQ